MNVGGLAGRCCWGRFHQHFCQTFTPEQDEFLANSAWRTAHRFGKFSRNFSLKSGKLLVKLNRNFFEKPCARASFCLAKKFGEIDP